MKKLIGVRQRMGLIKPSVQVGKLALVACALYYRCVITANHTADIAAAFVDGTKSDRHPVARRIAKCGTATQDRNKKNANGW